MHTHTHTHTYTHTHTHTCSEGEKREDALSRVRERQTDRHAEGVVLGEGLDKGKKKRPATNL